MIHEYLFLSDENKDKIEKIKPDGIEVEIYEIKETSLWGATFSLPHKNEESAKRLSEIHDLITPYSPLVLSCESSEYYNKALFPLINELERKLRKILYLAASISNNEKAKENVNKLEDKDFGEIFNLLFIDQNFIVNMKKRVNADNKSEFNGKDKFSKAEIQLYLNSISENTLWDEILGNETVPTLRNKFREVQIYRNDVMHAHNISKETFGKARNLFDKIYKELESAIGDIIGNTEDQLDKGKTDINSAISSALATMDLTSISGQLGNALSANIDMSKFAQALKDIQPKNTNVLADVLKTIPSYSIQPELLEQMKRLSSIAKESTYLINTEMLKTLQEQLKPYSELQSSIQSKIENIEFLDEQKNQEQNSNYPMDDIDTQKE